MLHTYMCIDLCINNKERNYEFERKWVSYKKLGGGDEILKNLFLKMSTMLLYKNKAEGFYMSNTHKNIL